MSDSQLAKSAIFESIVSNMSEGSLVISSELEVLFANDAAGDFFETTSLEGRSISDVLENCVENESHRNSIRGAIRTVLGDSSAESLEIGPVPSGDQLKHSYVELRISSLESDSQEIGGIVLLLKQIPDERSTGSDTLSDRNLVGQSNQLEKYRTVADNFPNGSLFLFDENLTYQVARGRGLAASDHDPDYIEGKTVEAVFDGDIASEISEMYSDTLSGKSCRNTIPYEEQTYDVQTVPIPDDSGEITAGLAITQEVTERIEREQELRRKTRALEEAPVGITISDPSKQDNPIVYANDKFTEITGYSKEDVLGRNCRLLQGQNTNQETVSKLRRAIDGQRAVSAEICNYRKDGSLFWNQLEIAPVYDESGKLQNYVGFQQDVTDRKQWEAELEETTRQLEAVLATVSAAIFMKDPSGRYILMNRACRELLGIGEDEEIIGYTDHDIFPPEYAEKFIADDRAVIESGEPLETEEEVPSETGTSTFLTRKSPILDESGGVYAICAVATDISELKQRERELEQFAYVTSHDLREPLRVISNYLQLLERQYRAELDETAQEYIDFAVDAAERMKNLIDGLLTYSRIERRGASFEPIDLNTVVDDALANLEIAIEQAAATISVDDLPKVDGDPDQLVTVFQNLVDNAITYSGEAPPEIEITVEEQQYFWTISVSDSGLGIEPSQADRAFEIFERLHTGETDGTGLGLALCQKIIDRHGGSIWLDSQPGEGTDVHFTLPKSDTE